MYIGRICYPVRVLGPGNRVGIWVTGCKRNCRYCMSPELKNRDSGVTLSTERICEIIDEIGDMDGITISGGEPFLQVKELISLVDRVSEKVNKDILIYTGFAMNELESSYPYEMEFIKSKVSVIIDGEYIAMMDNGKGLMGSENQKIYVYSNFEKYKNIRSCERRSQSFLYNGKIILIGIQ